MANGREMLMAARGAMMSNGGTGMEKLIALMNRTISGDIVFSGATQIPVYEFYQCTLLRNLSFPDATTVADFAFASSKNLETISLPNVTAIGSDHTFYECGATSIILPNLVSFTDNGAKTYAFGCDNSNNMRLESISLPRLTKVSNRMFRADFSLKTIDLPSVTEITQPYPFTLCYHLESINLPSVSTITSTTAFSERIGNMLPSGQLCEVTIGQTMSTVRGGMGGTFPWGDNQHRIKFICTDGYIVYENGAWTDHPNS